MPAGPLPCAQNIATASMDVSMEYRYHQGLLASQGFKIGCIEEIAWRAGWITHAELRERATNLGKSGYGTYLAGLLTGSL